MSTTGSDTTNDGMVRAEPAREARAADPRDTALPDGFERRYGRAGNRLLFPDGATAIEDRGTRLLARTDNPQVAQDIVEIARARGWERLSSHGGDAFRAEIARAAARRGLEVTNDERAARSPSRTADEPAATPPAPPVEARRARPPGRRVGDVITGRLIEAGEAPYRFESGAARSFYARIETETGTRDLWGKQLKEALAESWTWPQPGDRVGVQFLGSTAIQGGRSDADDAEPRRRNLWRIEKAAFYEERKRDAAAIRQGGPDTSKPESLSPNARDAAAILRAAQVFASDRLVNATDRDRFIDAVRGTLTVTTERGDRLPAIRLRETARTDETLRRTEPRRPDPAPTR